MLAIRTVKDSCRRPVRAFGTAAVLAGLLATPLAAAPATAAAAPITPPAPATTATTVAAAQGALGAAVSYDGTYYDDTYYRDAIGKTGAGLRSALHTIIGSQTKLSYAAVWNALKDTDQDPADSGNVILLYSGVSRAKSLNGGATGDWNREHVWAKSHGDFGTSTGPGTDLHHLRPEDVQVNGVRGNKDFDNGGSAVANGGGSRTDADSFEPRDAVKGDVARMIFYMAVRYEGDDGRPDLEVNGQVGNGSNPYMGRLDVLRAWNELDPPDAFEKRRNQVIYDSYQHNRNPFVDHPEWVRAIW
ncbi:endonuclease I family protein [Streptomyces sp. SHP 1-2]|uniref:endonuclease I family protein n=1 Tax=Streptomyces sp. SHP 1-2 TaxID=2769489 RepID=UPI00223725C0|nr:endonuclease [Streptomyces sp. SHP 1-2]MCW5251796.1 endonuclease [Streptomyces sp. SHP 1-2]